MYEIYIKEKISFNGKSCNIQGDLKNYSQIHVLYCFYTILFISQDSFSNLISECDAISWGSSFYYLPKKKKFIYFFLFIERKNICTANLRELVYFVLKRRWQSDGNPCEMLALGECIFFWKLTLFHWKGFMYLVIPILNCSEFK